MENGREERRKGGGGREKEKRKKEKRKDRAKLQLFPNYVKHLFVISLVGQQQIQNFHYTVPKFRVNTDNICYAIKKHNSQYHKHQY